MSHQTSSSSSSAPKIHLISFGPTVQTWSLPTTYTNRVNGITSPVKGFRNQPQGILLEVQEGHLDLKSEMAKKINNTMKETPLRDSAHSALCPPKKPKTLHHWAIPWQTLAKRDNNCPGSDAIPTSSAGEFWLQHVTCVCVDLLAQLCPVGKTWKCVLFYTEIKLFEGNGISWYFLCVTNIHGVHTIGARRTHQRPSKCLRTSCRNGEEKS